MKYFFIRFQIVLVSVILLITLGLLMVIVMRFNERWDFTHGKMYTLSEKTAELLPRMDQGKVELVAFYPRGEVTRDELEIFLKEAQMIHGDFEYNFYDPDRHPQLAKQWNVKDLYTVIISYDGRQERLRKPNEESFASALLRLLEPRVASACFVSGHGEASSQSEDRKGIKNFRDLLEENHYNVYTTDLDREQIMTSCQVLLIPGPQQDWDPAELELLEEAFNRGTGIFFMIDPMDVGSGKDFQLWMKEFGVQLGNDVIVDKMSRMVGGDFLVPFVNHYNADHPVTAQFDVATFFPVARSVFVSEKIREDVEVLPFAFSSTESWAEKDLVGLEKGEAAYDSVKDFPGPVSLAVSVERIGVTKTEESGVETMTLEPRGRMVVVGDSDFLSNGYLDLSGNSELGLKIVEWLTYDDRRVVLEDHHPKFQPLFLDGKKRLILILATLVGFPVFFLLIGTVHILWRKKVS